MEETKDRLRTEGIILESLIADMQHQAHTRLEMTIRSILQKLQRNHFPNRELVFTDEDGAALVTIGGKDYTEINRDTTWTKQLRHLIDWYCLYEDVTGAAVEEVVVPPLVSV